MTRNQQDQEMKNIREARKNNMYPAMELNRRSDLISCVSMIDSILCYGDFDLKKMDGEQVLKYERERNDLHYLKDYIEKFGISFIEDLINIQIQCIDHIERNTFTDDEGLRYNSIVYVDEL